MAPASRVDRLMAAAADVSPPGPGQHRGRATASAEHVARFEAYVRQLRQAKRRAEEWWKGLLEAETERIGDGEQAAINVRIRRPAGPVVDPHVIHVVRTAWLDCQAISQRSAENVRVPPEAFVLLWLREAGHSDLADFVAGLRYWPMGLDDTGTWT